MDPADDGTVEVLSDGHDIDITEILTPDQVQQLFDASDDENWDEVNRLTALYEDIATDEMIGHDVANTGDMAVETKVGGLDKNRGNAETLRRYWSIGGKGGAKIRWGTHGDWTRCVEHLVKYMGPRARGYCQLMHKRNDGFYTGSKLNKSLIGAAKRSDMADEGHAMPDGSYPIGNASDLKNAIHAVGRGNADHDSIRKFIMKRAKELDLMDLIPDNWKSDGSIEGKSVPTPADIKSHYHETESNSAEGDSTMPPGLIEHKTLEVKGLEIVDEEKGIVNAIISVTGIVDKVKDRIMPGAFEKSLASRTPKGIWSHDWDTPVSRTVEVKELRPGDSSLPTTDSRGFAWPSGAGALQVKTQFNLETQRGKDAFSDVKFFADEQEWSIGYHVPVGGAKIDTKTGVREINHMELYEYSPVLFGAMPEARTTSVKTAQLALKELNGKAAQWVDDQVETDLPPEIDDQYSDDSGEGINLNQDQIGLLQQAVTSLQELISQLNDDEADELTPDDESAEGDTGGMHKMDEKSDWVSLATKAAAAVMDDTVDDTETDTSAMDEEEDSAQAEETDAPETVEPDSPEAEMLNADSLQAGVDELLKEVGPRRLHGIIRKQAGKFDAAVNNDDPTAIRDSTTELLNTVEEAMGDNPGLDIVMRAVAAQVSVMLDKAMARDSVPPNAIDDGELPDTSDESDTGDGEDNTDYSDLFADDSSDGGDGDGEMQAEEKGAEEALSIEVKGIFDAMDDLASFVDSLEDE